MNDVKDLKPSNISSQTPTQTISLSALREDQNVNINATNGLSGVSEEAPKPQAIKITSNIRKTPRKSIENPSDIQTVNPDDYIEKPVEVRPITLQEDAITKLDAAVNRKRQEFKDFVQYAESADEANREKVEAGLESVNGEVQYIPDAIEKERENADGPVVVPTTKVVNTSSDDEDFDDVEADIEAELNADDEEETVESPIASSVKIEDPFAPEKNIEVTKTTRVETPIANKVLPEAKKKEEVKEESIDDKIQKDITKGAIEVKSTAIPVPGSEKSGSISDFELDDEDFEDVTYDTGDGEEQLSDEEFKAISIKAEEGFKKEIHEKIIQVSKTLDTSAFTISKKVISIKDAMKNAPTENIITGSWPMMVAGRPFISTALKGPEISLLADADDTGNENGIGLTMPQIRVMYDHDANPNKPQTIEAWAKTIPFSDVDNIFAAMFVASLKGANYIPMVCAKASCQYSYLTDAYNIMDMVKFNNDDIKSRFEEIKKVQLTPENSVSYDSVVCAINDRFAVGIKVPSIFTIIYEYGSLNSAFIRKYSTIVGIIQYIDYIYKIDEDTHEFQPIGWKPYVGDHAKTFKSKIATYAKILKELNDTDFSILIALINSMINKINETKMLDYEIPASKCPKCGADIEARPIAPRNLVFMRQRLVELATTPTEK